MAIQIRPGYINPLAMMADKKAVQKLGPTAAGQTGQADKVAELQTKQQQLQNQILLLKATGADSAGATEETQKVTEEALEKVIAELRSANKNAVQNAEPVEQIRSDMQSAAKTTKDMYEPKENDSASPGIYQVGKDEVGYKISFSPYTENRIIDLSEKAYR